MRVRAIMCWLVLLGNVSAAAAQGFVYGAKGGVNISTLAVDPEGSDYKSQLVLIAGGFVVRPFTGRLDLQAEGLFSMKGASVELGGTSENVRLDYIDVPVLVRYRIQGSDHPSIHAFGGPSFNFLVRARTIADLGNTKIDQDITDSVERFELGVVGGASVGLGRWIVEGRYTYGISDTDKDTSDDLKVRNRMFSVLGGLRF
jgi:hypothetical protein